LQLLIISLNPSHQLPFTTIKNELGSLLFSYDVRPDGSSALAFFRYNSSSLNLIWLLEDLAFSVIQPFFSSSNTLYFLHYQNNEYRYAKLHFEIQNELQLDDSLWYRLPPPPPSQVCN
jgi:hypothetical protein